jgi:hypothetical protein
LLQLALIRLETVVSCHTSLWVALLEAELFFRAHRPKLEMLLAPMEMEKMAHH